MMKRSKVSLSNYKLFSCDLGELVPIGMYEVLPGDTCQQATSALIRCSPLFAPVMHPVHVRIHHWFVPYRLVWEDWEKFITGGPDGLDASVFPTITMPASVGAAVGSLADYLGVPTGDADLEVSALPFRAYSLIFNEWYRDQDLVTPLTVDLTSGADTTTNTTLQNCAWEKDYFTAARPWEQKGPSINVPIGGTAPVSGIGWTLPLTTGASDVANVWQTGESSAATMKGITINSESATLFGATPNGTNAKPNIFANLDEATGINVTQFREAMALQRFEEARARYGSRYVEYLRYLGVRSSDARLQRPEYMGGGNQTIQFSEVLQTAEGENPVGSLAGHGIAAMRSNRYRRFFEEHGVVISLMSVKPRTMYANGLHRMWNRRVKEDFWQKELEHIGQQEVLNKEVYSKHSEPEGVFGYSDRYAEYRNQWSSIAGEFRTTLDFWHFARLFTSDPALNSDFVKCVPTERTFAVPSADVLWVMANHSIQARRLVSQSASSFIF